MKTIFNHTISLFLLTVMLTGFSRAQEPVYPQGKRFLLGLYSIDLDDGLDEYGWNIAQNYNTAENKSEFLGKCAEKGFLTLYKTEEVGAEESMVKKHVISSTPAKNIAWWDLPEEVKWYEEDSFIKLKELVEWTRKYDEYNRPVYLYLAGDFGVEDVRNYVPFIDIITASAYCNFKRKPHAFVRWIMESRFEAIREEGYSIGPDYQNGEKTVCAVLEVFDFTDSGDLLMYPQQAYHDFWQALACGAQGIMVYSYYHRNTHRNTPKYLQQYHLAAARLVGHEQLDQMILFGEKKEQIIGRVTEGPLRTPKFTPRVNDLSPKPPPLVEMDYPSINVLGKTWNNHLYIIAVNSAECAISAEIEGLSGTVNPAEVLFENRKVGISDGKITDDLKAWGVHIYKIPLLTSNSLHPKDLNQNRNKPGPITFSDVTVSVGLNEPLKGMHAHSVAWGDINSDNYPDLFVGTFATHSNERYAHRGHGAFPEPDKLLLNQGGVSFYEVTPSPTEIKGMSSGAAFADFDNDGHLDLVSAHIANTSEDTNFGRSNAFFRNDGNGKMIDVSSESNLIFNRDTIVCSARNTFVLDYDGDGLLDLIMQDDDAWRWSIGVSRLMRNTGNMVFEDVTNSAGLPKDLDGLGGFVGDINNDTWPDFYFSHINFMFINNRDGTFRKLDQEFFDPQYAANFKDNGNKVWTCGAELGDLNADGLLDFIIGDHYGNTLDHKILVFINMGNNKAGDPQFKEVSDKIGIKTVSQKEPYVAIEDYDNDGDMDILISTRESFIYTNTGIVKKGLPQFTGPTGSNAPSGGLEYWPAGGTVDFDRDGRLDYFGPQWEAVIRSPLLRNVTENAENYIAIRMDIPTEKNRNGIGATIRIYKPGQAGNAEALLGIKPISVSNGYSGGSIAEVHFGTPAYNNVDIVITMPCDGNIYTIKEVPTKQLFTYTGK